MAPLKEGKEKTIVINDTQSICPKKKKMVI
jgi:hypothetical protein